MVPRRGPPGRAPAHCVRTGCVGRSAYEMARYTIRLFGDPVLRQRASDVTTVDGSLVQLSEDMVDTLRAAPGLGLAAPQVGVQKRLFVYQMDQAEGPKV